MSYSPVELKHVRVGRRLLGYNRAAVEQLLEEVTGSFETVWRDRVDLAEKVERLETEVEKLRGNERLLTNTLVAAERAAEEVQERAKREADLIVADARGEARSIVRSARAEHERLASETHRLEALLRTMLGMVEQVSGKAGELPAEPLPPAPYDEVEQEAYAPTPLRPDDTGEREQQSEPGSQPEARFEPSEPEPRKLEPVQAADPRPLEEPEPVYEPDSEVEPAPEEVEPAWPIFKKAAGQSSGFDWGDP